MILTKFTSILSFVALAVAFIVELLFSYSAKPMAVYSSPTPRWPFYVAVLLSLVIGFAAAFYLCFLRYRFYGVPTA